MKMMYNKLNHRKTVHWLRQNARVFRCLKRYISKVSYDLSQV